MHFTLQAQGGKKSEIIMQENSLFREIYVTNEELTLNSGFETGRVPNFFTSSDRDFQNLIALKVKDFS